MEQGNARILSKIGSDLLAPPHILTALMELPTGDSLLDLSQQEQLFAHLAMCHYCRIAVLFLPSELAAKIEREIHGTRLIHKCFSTDTLSILLLQQICRQTMLRKANTAYKGI